MDCMGVGKRQRKTGITTVFSLAGQKQRSICLLDYLCLCVFIDEHLLATKPQMQRALSLCLPSPWQPLQEWTNQIRRLLWKATPHAVFVKCMKNNTEHVFSVMLPQRYMPIFNPLATSVFLMFFLHSVYVHWCQYDMLQSLENVLFLVIASTKWKQWFVITLGKLVWGLKVTHYKIKYVWSKS